MGIDIVVPVTKGKGSISVNTDDIPEDVYKEALLQGMKVLLNRGASKLTKESFNGDEEKLKAAAMTKAEEQLELVKTSKIKFTGGKAKSGVSGAVMTEARRLARNLVKDEMKRQDIKISHVEAKEITALANELIKEDPSLIETAKANLAEREAMPVKINVKAIPISEKRVKAAEARKAKDQLSAKQAGKVAKRSRPQTATAH